MRIVLLLFITIVLIQPLSGQNKTAKVNIEYLRDMVMPDFDERVKDLEQHMDSVTTVMMNMEQVKQWQLDIERESWVARPGYEDAKKEAEKKAKAQEAREGMSRLENKFQDIYSIEQKKRFKAYYDMRDRIISYKQNNDFDLVFEYGATGVMNILYKDMDQERRMKEQIQKCVKLPEGLSQAEQQAEFNKQAKQCEFQVMGPLWDEGIDITEDIALELRK